MRCSIISPAGRDEFKDVVSIHLAATTGERELLSGHIALITTLKEGRSLKLRMGGEPPVAVHVTVAAGSFIRFSKDDAEVLSARYTVEEG